MEMLPVKITGLLIRLVSLLPLSTSRALGRGVARLYLMFDTRRIRIAKINLQTCFPDKTEQERDKMLRDCISHAGMWLFESGAAWYWPCNKILRHIDIANPELLDKAVQQGNGVILAIPHLGNWEVVNSVVCSKHPFACLYKHDAKSPLISTYITQRRSQRGIEMAPANGAGIRRLCKRLKEGAIIGLLPDHRPSPEMGVFAPFFGQPALTGTLISSLARKHNARVLTATVVRTTTGFRIVYGEVTEQDNDDRLAAATGLNRAIESCIELAPAQYQWVYSRFSKQPNNAPSLYKRTSMTKCS